MGARDGSSGILMARPEPSVPSRLLKAVVAKSFLEFLVFCVVATLAAFSTFHPRLRGAIDVVDQTRVAGWVVDPGSPQEAIEVQLFIDEKLISSIHASEKRADLVESGVTSNPNHGFNFDLAPVQLAPGHHAAQVYAVRQTAGANKILLPIVQQPSVFEVRR
jgi:hypothetical protein